MKMVMRGRVDYDAVPELKGLDLDKYRKDSRHRMEDPRSVSKNSPYIVYIYII